MCRLTAKAVNRHLSGPAKLPDADLEEKVDEWFDGLVQTDWEVVATVWPGKELLKKVRQKLRDDHGIDGASEATPHQLLAHADGLAILRQLPANCADVVVTSPPYNIGVAYNSYSDRLLDSEYLGAMRCLFAELKRVLHEDGSLFLNVSGRPSKAVTTLRFGLMVSELFVLQNQIVWVKSIHVAGQTHGHFKPINSARYLNGTHEFIFHFTKTGRVPLDRLAVGVPYTDESNTRRWSHRENLHCNGNTWFIPYPTKTRSLPHPATFPAELPECCIRLHGIERCRLVLDPFGGLGTTTLAAIRCGVNSLCVEMDEEYHRVACRLAEAEAA